MEVIPSANSWETRNYLGSVYLLPSTHVDVFKNLV